MVQDIDEHDGVKAAVRKGQVHAIKLDNRYFGLESDQHVHALNAQVGPLSQKQRINMTIATADIKHAAVSWDQWSQQSGQTTNTAGEDPPLVEALQDIHFRDRPKMLRKKLDRTISTPKVSDTMAAATTRTR